MCCEHRLHVNRRVYGTMMTLPILRSCVLGLCAASVSGCASLPDWSLFDPLRTDSGSFASRYDFAWRLTGDPRVGPIQVFDDGRSTWLQFGSDQTVPAIFARTDAGDHLLTPQRSAAYVIVDGVWPLLVLRIGELESQARRLGPEAEVPGGASADKPALARDVEVISLKDGAEPESATALKADSTLSQPEAPAFPTETPAYPVEAVAFPTETPAFPAEAVAFPLPPSFRSPPLYRVSPDDGNIRTALARWARSAGWTFEAEHWAVEVDIPIAGSAEFDLQFDEAVQELLASTELSERPLQPCFYANKVLRVVSYAQSCDPTATREHA